MFLAVLGLTIDDTLTRLNAVKQAMALAVNVAAAALFVGAADIVWPAAVVMGVGTLIGGAIGGRAASLISPTLLRRIVVLSGFALALIFAIRAA